MKIDVPAEVARASSALAQKPAALQGAPLLGRAGAVWRACGHQAKAEALSLEAAERWVEAADDVRERQKEYLLRACDSFLGAGRFDRAAGSPARAVALGEDSFSQARLMQPPP